MKTGGRKKGTPNKISRETKENLLIAFDRLKGVEGLVKWANKDDKNRGEFYKLWAKTLPMTLASDKDNPLVPEIIRIQLIRAPTAAGSV